MHTRDKKLYGLQNIGGLLGAKELSHHRQAKKEESVQVFLLGKKIMIS